MGLGLANRTPGRQGQFAPATGAGGRERERGGVTVSSVKDSEQDEKMVRSSSSPGGGEGGGGDARKRRAEGGAAKGGAGASSDGASLSR